MSAAVTSAASKLVAHHDGRKHQHVGTDRRLRNSPPIASVRHDAIFEASRKSVSTNCGVQRSRGHSVARYRQIESHSTGHGFTFQMPLAYSAMVRSLENLPELAMFRMTFRVHA